MERFGFWRVENPEKSRHKAPLAEWADKLEVGGALLPDLVLQDGVGFDSPALMTFSQFSDLIQTVRTIEVNDVGESLVVGSMADEDSLLLGIHLCLQSEIRTVVVDGLGDSILHRFARNVYPQFFQRNSGFLAGFPTKSVHCDPELCFVVPLRLFFLLLLVGVDDVRVYLTPLKK